MLEEVATVSEEPQEHCFVLGSLGFEDFFERSKHDY